MKRVLEVAQLWLWAILTTEPLLFFLPHCLCVLVTLFPLKAETKCGAYLSNFVCCVTFGAYLSKWQGGGETDWREEDIACWLLLTQLFEQVNCKSWICQLQGVHCGPGTKEKRVVVSQASLKCPQLHSANPIRILFRQIMVLGRREEGTFSKGNLKSQWWTNFWAKALMSERSSIWGRLCVQLCAQSPNSGLLDHNGHWKEPSVHTSSSASGQNSWQHWSERAGFIYPYCFY